MNVKQRKELQKAFDLIEGAKEIIEAVKDEEQEAHDNLPESIQNGERGEEMEGYIGMMYEAYEYLESANSQIEEII